MKNIAFITDRDTLAPLISFFRKSSINAKKCHINEDLSTYDVLIIDLAYSLDLAYSFLEKVKKDYKASDKILISVISHRSQVKKLRSLALGCDSYISPEISYNDLYKKIKELKDPDNFLIQKTYSNTESTFSIDALLTHISETGCLIKSRTRFSNTNQKLQIEGKFFDDLTLKNRDFRIKNSTLNSRRRYLSEVSFNSLDEVDISKIREVIKDWSVR